MKLYARLDPDEWLALKQGVLPILTFPIQEIELHGSFHHKRTYNIVASALDGPPQAKMLLFTLGTPIKATH